LSDVNETIWADPNTRERLVIKPAPMPDPQRHEALIKVAAISLNRGETRRAFAATVPWTPGWDFAGTVARAAGDDSGPPAGARVVGLLTQGAWSRYVAAPSSSLAVLPDAVSFTEAATLPVAGLTALLALAHGGLLLDRKVLITGATGGVGDFAIQLARSAGARVIAVARQTAQVAALMARGAHDVVVGEALDDARRLAPYDLIVESVGGRSLGAALGLLAKHGTCVSLGVSASEQVTFDARQFFVTGGASLYGFILFTELEHEPAGIGLSRLANLIASGHLRPMVSREAPWRDIARIAEELIDRRYPGKAVLHID
jgi:NADPH:quinone reductase